MSAPELRPGFAAVSNGVVEDFGGDLVCGDVARDETAFWCGRRLPRTSTADEASQ